jgi:hypothetical protein
MNKIIDMEFKSKSLADFLVSKVGALKIINMLIDQTIIIYCVAGENGNHGYCVERSLEGNH